MRKFLTAIFAAAFLCLISACTTVPSTTPATSPAASTMTATSAVSNATNVLMSLNPQELQTAQLIIQVATVKFIGTGSNAAARAARVKAVVNDAIAATNGGTAVNLAILQSLVQAEIAKDNLWPADQLLVNDLVATVQQDLNTWLGAGNLTSDQEVAVRTVLQWILDAANMTGS